MRVDLRGKKGVSKSLPVVGESKTGSGLVSSQGSSWKTGTGLVSTQGSSWSAGRLTSGTSCRYCTWYNVWSWR